MEVLSEFIDAITIESQKKIDEYNSQMGLPPNEREAKGVLMRNLQVKFEFFDGIPNTFCDELEYPLAYIKSATIICENNISKFKEGSSVILSHGKFAFEMELDEDSIDNFILKPNDFKLSSCFIDINKYPTNNWEINDTKSDILEKMLSETAKVLSNDSDKLLRIETFLNGKTTNAYARDVCTVDYLNSSQNTSLNNAVNASDFCIIQGPPGTGKTETIANIAKTLMDQGKKVFITAPTHTAINNCLNAISKRVLDKTKVVKIGNKAQNKEIENNGHITIKLSLQYPTYQRSPELNQKGIVIGATPYSVCYDASKKLRFWEFDVCIVDEASQLSIPLSLAAMSRSAKFIFVGDHKQLDPIIPKDTENEMFAESIFSRLARIYRAEINLLNTSYRLNKSLIEIPNKLFYEDLLVSSDTTIKDDSKYECQYHSDIINNDPPLLVLHNEFDGISHSTCEARIVSEIVFDLAKNGAKLSEIGIVTPYRAQVREIKKELKKAYPKLTNDHFRKLFVDTVDSIQGQERNYIIYSMANSHPLESMRRLGFFYSPNRLNVAITRAIKKCIVIANSKVFDIIDEELQEHEEYEEIKESLDVFKQYFALSTKLEIKKSDEW